MRFLVVTMSNNVVLPPEMVAGMANALRDWARRYTASGQMEQVWGFAGQAGGGGILNVNSFDELDQIMVEFPFGPFSKIDVYPLVDLEGSLDRFINVLNASAPAPATPGVN